MYEFAPSAMVYNTGKQKREGITPSYFLYVTE
jgi:hypothetical protein